LAEQIHAIKRFEPIQYDRDLLQDGAAALAF